MEIIYSRENTFIRLVVWYCTVIMLHGEVSVGGLKSRGFLGERNNVSSHEHKWFLRKSKLVHRVRGYKTDQKHHAWHFRVLRAFPRPRDSNDIFCRENVAILALRLQNQRMNGESDWKAQQEWKKKNYWSSRSHRCRRLQWIHIQWSRGVRSRRRHSSRMLGMRICLHYQFFFAGWW